ncbi:MAG: 7-carboxy-7-deazaguanine synthase QueE [Candidatus Krumholzibacteriia bacterium]
MDKNIHADRGRVSRPVRAPGMDAGYVAEMFCSLQGEGLFVGERQVFLRIAGCKATCYWCDTVAGKEELDKCAIHGLTKRMLPNPMSTERVVEETMALIEHLGPVGTVSITGGEPLEQPDFVASIAKRLRRKKLRVYLETNGLEIWGLRKVRPHVDVIAMDIKLPHATGKSHWEEHREFLTYLPGKTSFIKVIVDAPTPLEEIKRAVKLIASVDRDLPVVLQPESTTLKNLKGPEARKVLGWLLEEGQRFALMHLRSARVIPQCHKILKVR